jgi:hypothetical protein
MRVIFTIKRTAQYWSVKEVSIQREFEGNNRDRFERQSSSSLV